MRQMSEEEEIAQAMRLSLAHAQTQPQPSPQTPDEQELDRAIALSLYEQDQVMSQTAPVDEERLAEDFAVALSLEQPINRLPLAPAPQRAPINNNDQLEEDFAIALSLEQSANRSPLPLAPAPQRTQHSHIAPQEDLSHDEAVARLLAEEDQSNNTSPASRWGTINYNTAHSTQRRQRQAQQKPPQVITPKILETAIKRLNPVNTTAGIHYECPVCQESFPLKDSRWTVASSQEGCQHALCKECKKGILKSGYSELKCPMCRQLLEKSQDGQ